MQHHHLPAIPDLLPGAAQPAQRRHTFTLHSPRYASLAALRKHLYLRLTSWRVNRAYIERLQLSVCKIVTNLIKHPANKPSIVHISISLHADGLMTDIADNGSPFATFDAKCNQALNTGSAYERLAECGYGLSCILMQHQQVSYRPATLAPDALNHFILQDAATSDAGSEAEGDNLDPPHKIDKAISQQPDRKTVFIVDDDINTLELHAKTLRRTYDVHAFQHAEHVLQQFALFKPALIIADLSMSGMEGITLRKHLSQLDGGDTVPFVFLGNTAAIAHERYVTQAGIDDYLCKPVSADRLLAVSARLIERTNRFAAAIQDKVNTRITTLLHPELPHSSGHWRIATRSAVADTGGGDFTIFNDADDGLTAALADVMGSGQHAKFFAYAYAGYLRSLMSIHATDHAPASFLSRVSAAVNADSFLDSTIMTCISFHLGHDNTIRLASAGHPPPWLVDGAQSATPIDIAGPLPGLLGESRYLQKEIALEHRQRLVLATDGFWDNWGNPQSLSFDLRLRHQLPLVNYANELWQSAQARASSRPDRKDDATLIVIEAGDAP